ncbi:CACTA en-spm transposon protein [Cucumis melo var. makuwa]|uniref:CACTA en-spm transposon protein n=1 Tax=Cucumis melo var. makuwa TaxID=1194695 RepID=A0A5D3DJ43_CUCMM|nr:CACTA en-spm transposon protein [Cucumis melo var. makuwa]TYK23488.1 CACTA en-spm transposon protein [Cucumis melo var. makuwa]
MLCSSSKEDDLDNLARGSSSAGDNTGSSSQPPSTSTSRRHAQSRLLELEHHVAVNGRIPMTIAPGAEKPISLYVVRFSQAIDIHFKKYNDLEEARANPPNVLVGRHEDWHFLCDHYMCIPGIIIAAGQSCFYNDSTSSLSKKGSRSIVWSCFEKHMFESGRPCRRSQRMCIIKCWNSSPSLPQKGPKPKARKTTSASSSTTSWSQSATEREIQIQAKLDQALERIKLQDRNYQALASEMEQMRKLIQDMTRAQQGPAHYP